MAPPLRPVLEGLPPTFRPGRQTNAASTLLPGAEPAALQETSPSAAPSPPHSNTHREDLIFIFPLQDGFPSRWTLGVTGPQKIVQDSGLSQPPFFNFAGMRAASPAAAVALGLLFHAQGIHSLQVLGGLLPLRAMMHAPENTSPSHSSKFAVSFQRKPVSFPPPANIMDKAWTDANAPSTTQHYPTGSGNAGEGVQDASFFAEDPQAVAGGAQRWKGLLNSRFGSEPGRLASSFFKATKVVAATLAVWFCIHMLYMSTLTVLAAFSAPSPWRAATWAKAFKFARCEEPFIPSFPLSPSKTSPRARADRVRALTLPHLPIFQCRLLT